MREIVRNIKYQKNETKLVSLPLVDKNFGLSESEFNELLKQLIVGKEILFEQIFLSHFDDCKYYLISKYKLREEFAYDIAMDTLILFRKKLILGKIKYGNLRYLFTKMATQLFIKGKQREDKLLELDFQLHDNNETQEQLYKILQKSWENLSANDKNLLEAYYYNKIPLIKIAESEGLSDSNIRKRKQRSLNNLRTLFLNFLSIDNE